jgi:hypothetical protein
MNINCQVMGRRCIFIDCPNSGDKKVPFEKIHAFPAVGTLQRKVWIMKTALDIKCRNLNYFGICQRHFLPQSYRKWKGGDGENFVKTGWLKLDAVPTLLSESIPHLIPEVESEDPMEIGISLSQMIEGQFYVCIIADIHDSLLH